MRLLAPLILLPISACAGGCIAIPIPIPHAACNPDEFAGRDQILPDSMSSLKPRQTTREQVLLALGEPDACWNAERCLMYLGHVARGTTLYAVASLYGLGGTYEHWGEKQLLLMEFDSRGVLLRHEVKLTPLTASQTSVAEIAEQWAGAPAQPPNPVK